MRFFATTFGFLLLLHALPALAEEAHGGGGGLPQFNTATYPSQIFWLFVSFVVLFVLMSRMVLPPISRTLEARYEKRVGDLEQAEKLRTETAEIRQTYEQALQKAQEDAQSLIHTAEAEIKETAARRHASFSENARKRTVDAEEKIAKVRKEALTSAAEIAAEIAADALSKVAGLKVSKADAKKLVETSMKERA